MGRKKIDEADLKKLWGRAAGRCALCGNDLLPLLGSQPDVIGEMAHVIGYKKDAARGCAKRQYDNSYDNLILLCPTCHTKVDKAPKHFSVKTLKSKKREWEDKVARKLDVEAYKSLRPLCRVISKILIENYEIWKEYGPESKVAADNPLSNMAKYWELRKLDTIVPNNRRIIGMLEASREILPKKLFELACKFKEHALMFEQNCYAPIDNATRFPIEFEEVINAHAK